MNIFSALFGIFRQSGLVTMVKEGHSLKGFTISAIIVSIFGGLLYGFAMGIGFGPETAIRTSRPETIAGSCPLHPRFWRRNVVSAARERLRRLQPSINTRIGGVVMMRERCEKHELRIETKLIQNPYAPRQIPATLIEALR